MSDIHKIIMDRNTHCNKNFVKSETMLLKTSGGGGDSRLRAGKYFGFVLSPSSVYYYAFNLPKSLAP